jgi:hypothetical protein
MCIYIDQSICMKNKHIGSRRSDGLKISSVDKGLGWWGCWVFLARLVQTVWCDKRMIIPTGDPYVP